MDLQEKFIPPLEAPVFFPSSSEFSDPLVYIAKIRHEIEQYGICKIRPPSDWRPPFAIDPEKFRFVPRVQKVNELEATTRVKLIFLGKLYKFWDLQGIKLKPPIVGRKALDFHKLHKFVQEEGGFEFVTMKNAWSEIATNKMGLPSLPSKSYGTLLRSHYEKFLYPYDLYEARASLNVDVTKKVTYSPYKSSPQQMSDTSNLQQSADASSEKDADVDYSKNSELKRLQFFGAGKKVALPSLKKEMEEGKPVEDSPNKRELRDRTRMQKTSYLEFDICTLCGKTHEQDKMLTCSVCEETYHKFCVLSAAANNYDGEWRCPACAVKEYRMPNEIYGFEQSEKDYSLATFKSMADKFKEDYFKKTTSDVTCEEVEQEFWRLTKNYDEEVAVLYGADIHSLTNGSGFPTQERPSSDPDYEKYSGSKWNLNVLPVLKQSVLSYVSGDVSGMKVPWCYVGMCFSTFCWHIEDHWSYSINYLHWGEPKTWYGVPSSHAEKLEEVMKSRAPELFEQSPDLLHHITTMMNPNSLMSHGIPVVRTNQCAGDYIITCPRAYHAGFNQGYNFAEAVNFCPADWLQMGGACIKHYKTFKRYCVFSHEELVCKMAADADNLDLHVAMDTLRELITIIDEERLHRKHLLEMGVTQAERESFELLADDERQCQVCKTTCFLSAVTCPCKPSELACIEHIEDLCSCPGSNKCLRYRYTLDEFPDMIKALKDRIDRYQRWLSDAQMAVSPKHSVKSSYSTVKALISTAKENQYPDSQLVKDLIKIVKEAEKYVSSVKELVNRRARTRRHTELAIKSAARRLSLKELKDLLDQLEKLDCVVSEAQYLHDLYARAALFQSECKLAITEHKNNRNRLEQLYEVGLNLDLDMDEVGDLSKAIERSKWIEEVLKVNKNVDEDNGHVTVDELKLLVKQGESVTLDSQVVDFLIELEERVKKCEDWEEKASICLHAKPRCVITTIETLIQESKNVKVYLPTVDLLKDCVKRATDWKIKASAVLKSSPQPTLDQLKALFYKAKSIPVKLELVDEIESLMNNAELWKLEASKHFLKPGAVLPLLDVLLPRQSTPITPKKRQQKKTSKQQPETENSPKHKLIDHLYSTDGMYQKSIKSEIETIKLCRKNNEDASQKQCRCGVSGTVVMLRCELCSHWMHSSCFEKIPNSDLAESCMLCHDCVRSCRPRLDVILKLLVMLDDIPIRLAEGEALQYLTERAIDWQEKIKKFFNLGKVTKFLHILNKGCGDTLFIKVQSGMSIEKPMEDVWIDHDYLTKKPKVDQLELCIGNEEHDDAVMEEMNNLLLEGFLLEVSVPEMGKLWKYSIALKEYFASKLEPDCVRQPEKVQAKSILSPRDINADKEDISMLVYPETISQTFDRKRKTLRKNRGTKKRKSTSSSHSHGKDLDNEDEWGEYDDNCAAKNGCLLPDDESVGWVQCDSCQRWFHFLCINRKPDELSNEMFICEMCELPSQSNPTAESLTNTHDSGSPLDLPSHLVHLTASSDTFHEMVCHTIKV